MVVYAISLFCFKVAWMNEEGQGTGMIYSQYRAVKQKKKKLMCHIIIGLKRK